MYYKKHASEGSHLVPIVYRFLEPIKAKVRHPDGTVILIGYGIGDKIEVLEPDVQLLLALHEKLTEIPLADGSFIIEFPERIRMEHQDFTSMG